MFQAQDGAGVWSPGCREDYHSLVWLWGSDGKEAVLLTLWLNQAHLGLGGLLTPRMLGSTPRASDSGGLGREDPQMCISVRFLGAAGAETPL